MKSCRRENHHGREIVVKPVAAIVGDTRESNQSASSQLENARPACLPGASGRENAVSFRNGEYRPPLILPPAAPTALEYFMSPPSLTRREAAHMPEPVIAIAHPLPVARSENNVDVGRSTGHHENRIKLCARCHRHRRRGRRAVISVVGRIMA